MADFQAKICEKFNIKSLTDNQSKSITAIIDGKDVFVGTQYFSVNNVWVMVFNATFNNISVLTMYGLWCLMPLFNTEILLKVALNTITHTLLTLKYC
jgi:hypothetical protein